MSLSARRLVLPSIPAIGKKCFGRFGAGRRRRSYHKRKPQEELERVLFSNSNPSSSEVFLTCESTAPVYFC